MRHRFGNNATQQDVARFVNGSKGLGTSVDRFACFQFLLHLAEILDIDTALNMATNVAHEMPQDSAMVELLESII